MTMYSMKSKASHTPDSINPRATVTVRMDGTLSSDNYSSISPFCRMQYPGLTTWPPPHGNISAIYCMLEIRENQVL